MPDVSRRGFIRNGLFGLGGLYVTTALTGCGSDSDDNELGMGRFAHGVASGDPLSDSVILWTGNEFRGQILNSMGSLYCI